MDIINLISRLKHNNIDLSLSGNDLEISYDGEELPVAVLSEIKTNKAQIVDFLKKATQGRELHIPIANKETSYPVSSSQRRLWIVSQLEEGSRAYNLPGVYVFEGNLDRKALENSLRLLITRHEILRTVFRENEQALVQQYIYSPDECSFELVYHDVRGMEWQEQNIKKQVQEETARPFDLTTGPLLRTSLYQLANNKWIFIYVIHHIISDGWSMNILVNELLLLYNAQVRGAGNPLTPLSIQYKDYAVWQQQQLSGSILEDHRSYWLRQFEGELPVLDLPANNPRPAVKTYNGATISSHIRADVCKEMITLCREQGATLFMGLLAVVDLLLYRYTAQTDIIVGSPVAGRDHTGLENQIGFYVNTLALRSRFNGCDTGRSLLALVKRTTLDAYDHQVYPFDELVEELRLLPDKSRNALFDVMVVLQNTPVGSTNNMQQMGDLKISTYSEQKNTVSKFDLTFNFSESAGNIGVEIEYNSDIYLEGTIWRMFCHLEQLMAAFVQWNDIPIAELNYLGEEEKVQLLHLFNKTTAAFPDDKTLISLFEAQVKATPHKIALVTGTEEISYNELNTWANQLGSYLRERYTVAPDDLVAVQLQRSKWMIIGLLGVLKSGGAYVPIDPDYPQERIDYMLADSHCKVLINEQLLDEFMQQATSLGENDLQPLCNAGNLAYVIYTSGSTGKPKGCLLEHRGIVNRLHWMWKQYGFSGGDIILQKTSFTFDVSVWEIFLPLCWGAKMVLCQQEDARSPERILTLIKEQRVTCLHFVPGMLNEFMASLFDQEAMPVLLKSLRNVITSGEALTAETVKRWYSKVNIPLHNLYGPTEASVDITYYATSRHDNKIPIGRPISNTRIYILDAAGQLVPVGVKGQIYIGGTGLARGYLNRPELTTEKFVPSSFQPEELVYRTGDAGKWLPDGNIEFLGRMDDQVKIRGYRIELGEIECGLLRYQGIDAAVVTVKTDKKGYSILVAYLTGKVTLNTLAIRSHLAQSLPGYMLPDYYVQLDKLPVNASGKIDRKRLPDPEGISIASGTAYIPPGNETEKKLATLWKELLGSEQVGLKDNFFYLGGHSLRAARLVSHIYKAFQVKLKLKEIFDYPTLQQQASLIQQAQKASFIAIPSCAAQPDYPVSSSQKRIWLLCQLEPGNIAYNISTTFLFQGDLNYAALTDAFLLLIQRHESLRTVFIENKHGEVRQYILTVEALSFSIQYSDVRQEAGPQQAANKLVKEECLQPFDLATGPLLRASLYRIENTKWIFNLVMHHIVVDEWSINIAFTELLAFYKAACLRSSISLPPLRIQYKDYATWQQEQLYGDESNSDRAYWLQQMEGELPVTDIPIDKIRPVLKTYNGGAVSRKLNAGLTRGIQALARQQGATLFMGLLATVKALLYRYTGERDIIIGSSIAGRQQVELENQVGIYLNTLALRTRWEEGDSFLQLLENVRKITTEAYVHQAYPFDLLVNELQSAINGHNEALFNVMVELQNNDALITEGNDEAPALQLFEYKTEKKDLCKFDLHFEFKEQADEIDYTIIYNSDIYLPATVNRIADHLEQLLVAVLEHPAIPVEDLDYLNATEKEQLLIEFNNTGAFYAENKTVIDLFQEQVFRTPNAIALVFEETQISYRELDEQSNCLANYLLANHAIRPNDTVAVLLNRSAEMIIALLAVLKSGAAYIPIDPENPSARINYMLKQSGTGILITTSKLTSLLTSYEGDCFLIDQSTRMPDSYRLLPKVSVRPGNLAYVIYTSGSTGHPKGAMIRHECLVDYFFGVMSKTNMGQCHHFGLVSTIAADLGNTVIYTSLLTGGALHIFSREALLDPEKLFKEQLDCLKIVPSHWQSLQQANKIFLPHKCLIFGGEALTPGVLEKIRSTGSQCQVYNHYGPTETTIGKIISRIDLENIQWPVALGSPFGTTAVYIVDARHKLVPPGVAGEICIAGTGVADGYIHQPELTVEKFVPNPFRRSDRMYTTGDLGRWLANGTIEFLGRRDDQVKIHGYRIETGEIENVLRSHPDIDSAFVLAKAGQQGVKELIAYIVNRKEGPLSDIRSWLTNMLPVYMVPAHFIFLEQLPLTLNGKVDRRQLPDPESDEALNSAEAEPINDHLTQTLLTIWKEVLGKQTIGAQDDYFLLGGNSLKVISILKKMADVTGIVMPIKKFFSERTIENMVAWLRHSMAEATAHAIEEAPVGKEQPTICEASYNQLTFLSGWKKSNPLVITPYEFVTLDIKAFEVAVNQLIARHEILRTQFIIDNGAILQKITPPGSIHFEIQEPFHIASDEALNQMVETTHARKIDPFADPLLFIEMYRLPNANYLAMLTMHHALTDGYSDGVLRGELMQCYNAVLQKQPLSLQPLPYQYRDYVKWQQNFLHSAEGQRSRAYWLKKLDGCTYNTIPVSREMTLQHDNYAGKSFHITRIVEGELFEKADSFAQNNGFTRVTVLMGVLNFIVQQLAGCEDVSLFVTVSGRNSMYYGSLDWSSLIGYFANSIIIRSRVNNQLPAGSYFQQVQQEFLDGLSHDAYPIYQLVRELPGIAPQSFLNEQIFFNYHNYSYLNEHNYTVADDEKTGVLRYREPLQMCMGLTVKEYGNCLKLEMAFDHCRFTAAEAIAILDYYYFLLTQVVANEQLLMKQLMKPEQII